MNAPSKNVGLKIMRLLVKRRSEKMTAGVKPGQEFPLFDPPFQKSLENQGPPLCFLPEPKLHHIHY